MAWMKDLTGLRFGRLVAVNNIGKNKNGSYKWVFRCDCGNEKIINTSDIGTGRVNSCGCLKKELLRKTYTRHGEGSREKGESKEFRIWSGMRARCFAKNNPGYKNYGGRGITICERWREYKNFLQDMGRCPKGLMIERKNNNDNYSPDNCIWASWDTQARNRRSTRLLTDGKVTLCLKDWAKLLDISEQKLRNKLTKNIKTLDFSNLTEI